MTNGATSRQKLPATVVALGVTSFFADIGSEMIFPLLPVFVASLGAGATFLGLVEGVADATSSFLKLASGYVADRLPRKKPLVLFGYGIAALARPLMAVATAPWHVLVIRSTDRIGKGIRSSPRDVLIASSVSGAESGRAFGFHRAMDHAGAVVGPILATVLLSFNVPLRTVFWLALVPGMLSVVAVATVRETPIAPMMPTPPRAHPRPHLPRSLRWYLAILVLFSLGNSSEAFLLLRAKDIGVPIHLIPLLWTTFHVVKLLSSYVGGAWSDRLPRQTLIVSGWMVFAVTYLAFGAATKPWHAWALFLVFGTYYGLTEPAEKALVRDLAPQELRGRAYGLYNFILGICAVPAGLMTGWLWQTWNPFVALASGAALAATASVALMAWARASR
ncbi:MAG: MFS transporter [Myxococcaceae bacterium]